LGVAREEDCVKVTTLTQRREKQNRPKRMKTVKARTAGQGGVMEIARGLGLRTPWNAAVRKRGE